MQQYTHQNLLGVLWEYAGDQKSEDSALNKEWLSEAWTSASIISDEGAKNGIYKITLSNLEKQFTTIARPVYKGKVLDAENQQFNAELAAFNNSISQQINQIRQSEAQEAMMRYVTVNQLGLYNYDRQLKYPDMVPLVATFDFGADSIRKFPISVFLITGNGLAVVEYVPNTYPLFRFSPLENNKLIAILPSKEVCTFSSSKFVKEVPQKAKNNPEKYVFKMHKTGVVANNAADLDKLIKNM